MLAAGMFFPHSHVYSRKWCEQDTDIPVGYFPVNYFYSPVPL
jgi:hypothetical protein